MFNTFDEAARALVDFCEQDKKKSCIVILSEQTSEEDVQTIVAVNGTGGLLKGSIACALAKNKRLRSLFMDGVTRSIFRLITEGEATDDPEEAEPANNEEEK